MMFTGNNVMGTEMNIKYTDNKDGNFMHTY
jgi:hypothetical protein